MNEIHHPQVRLVHLSHKYSFKLKCKRGLMLKYMILLVLLLILTVSWPAPTVTSLPRPGRESFKTLEKGPVLHPLRQKPYQKKSYLA